MTGPHPLERHHAVDDVVYGELAGRDGTLSAEHGIGFMKKPFLATTRNPSQLALLRKLKQVLDPGNLLNPGRVID
jgi:FAD/FMN-containing dehydrogenase